MANLPSLDDSTFDEAIKSSGEPVLVDFGATWCGPCRQLAPIVEGIAKDYAGKLKVFTVDIDAAPKSAQRFTIRSVPTLILFKGGEKVGQVIGLVPRDKIIKQLGL
ncbi:thioredoxin [Sorangium sp. So ce1335]|uniref:thioredoxin n=1 Tax=Sorangium sp. So ce1335 TaxID=3133335 RepID=UPI003F63C14B